MNSLEARKIIYFIIDDNKEIKRLKEKCADMIKAPLSHMHKLKKHN